MFEDSVVFSMGFLFSSLSILTFEILPPEAEFLPSLCGLIDVLIGIALFDNIFYILMATVILAIYRGKTVF